MVLSLLITAILSFAPTSEAGRCGLGCQRTMGNCVVNEALWNASVRSGVTMTSCCRSPEYNRELRSCGYRPAVNSLHMSGNAVDLALSPRSCTTSNLASMGFPAGTCGLYHANHCHVSRCGTPASVYQARTNAQQRAHATRQRHRSGQTAQRRAQIRTPVQRYQQPYAQQSSNPISWMTGGMR